MIANKGIIGQYTGVQNEILSRQKGIPSIAMTGWKNERSAGSDPLEFGGWKLM